MPRCQRTFRYLGDGQDSATWVCSHCGEQEAYIAIRDPDLLAYAAFAQRICGADFGEPSDADCPVFLWRGIRPECVYEPVDGCYEIYLKVNSDPLTTWLQLGHEIFHRVAGEGRVFHWTHEMFACLISVRLLNQRGFTEYADLVTERYQAESRLCSFTQLVRADPWSGASYPDGYYGRAFVVGIELCQAVGYRALCLLARLLNHAAVPDVPAWLESLPLTERNAAKFVLGNEL